ncbi:hypothetical protein EJ110_NYTH35585 [Nymphaea thermarum]|nr:hypothetical protein EJ110_NYTH35585 [Nymphaea thermarum]
MPGRRRRRYRGPLSATLGSQQGVEEPRRLRRIDPLYRGFSGSFVDLLKGKKMEINGGVQRQSILGFLKEKGFDEKCMGQMLQKCKHLEFTEAERAQENWKYFEDIGIPRRKLPALIRKCPKLLVLGLDERLKPTVECLKALSKKPKEVTSAILKFPYILSHSVEEKLCPLLAFFQALGIPEAEVGKLIMLNPRLISYSIELKLLPVVDFLTGLVSNKEGAVGRILVKNPYIMGYSIEKRLRPTADFLRSIGLKEEGLQRVAMTFPQVLCRDAEKTLRPNLEFLRTSGLGPSQIAKLVAGFPPVLVKSIKNSLEPRIRFLVHVMGRNVDELAEYPEFFQHGLKKRIEFRYRLMSYKQEENCSLVDIFECNQKKFALRFGLPSIATPF